MHICILHHNLCNYLVTDVVTLNVKLTNTTAINYVNSKIQSLKQHLSYRIAGMFGRGGSLANHQQFTKLLKPSKLVVTINNLFKPGAWFPKIDPVWIIGMRVCVCVCVCVCLRPRLLITSDVMWRDMNPI